MSTICRRFLPCILLLAAGISTSAELRAEEAGTIGGTISGRVLDALTGVALADSMVQLFDAGGSAVSNAMTDAAGRYTLTAPLNGTYFALASPFGYQSELWEEIACAGCEPTTGTALVLTGGASLSGINFTPTPFGHISGAVTSADNGAPLVGWSVSIFNSSGAWVESLTTTFEGFYRSQPLAPGNYTAVAYGFNSHIDELYFDIPCFQLSCDPTQGTPIEVPLAADVTGINFSLDRSGAISGTLTEAGTGTPLVNANVTIWRSDGTQLANTGTDSQGSYITQGLAPGSYFVTAGPASHRIELWNNIPCPGGPPVGCNVTSGQPVVVTVATTTAGINFSLDRLGRISGRIFDADTGQGLNGDPFIGSVAIFNSSGQQVGSGRSLSDGNYITSGLNPGTYWAVTRVSGYLQEVWDNLPCGFGPPQGCDFTTGTPLAVALGSEITGIDFGLESLGRVRGQIRDDFTHQPLSFASVRVFNNSGEFAAGTNTDFQGRYNFLGLLPGTYTVEFSQDLYRSEMYNDVPCPLPPAGCDVSTGLPLVVPLNADLSNIDAGLRFVWGIQGTVTAQGSGSALPGVGLDLWDAAGNYVSSTSSGIDGRYRFEVFGGDYFVSTDSGVGGADEIWEDRPCYQGPAYTGDCDPTSGTLVSVLEGAAASSNIDFALSVIEIFADGFESGDTSAWTTTVP